MKKHLPIVLLTLSSCFFLLAGISLLCAGCQSKYGRNIPAKEMAIYNAESRIRLLRSYDPEYNKEEIKKLEAQIASLQAAIKKEKEDAKK